MSIRKIIHGTAQALIIVSYLSSTVASAQPGQGSGERRGPPPEAIEACADQTVDTACSFTGHRGEVVGSCIVSPKDDEGLICAPEGGPPSADHGQ